jgi:phospholipid transport system substrate-binding protein
MKSSLKLLPLILAFTVQLFAAQAFAAGSGPDEQVKSTVNDVLGVLRQHKDKRALRQVAEEKVAPNFDFEQMTRLAVGRSWSQATPDQQKALETNFKTLLINTYTNALSQASTDDKALEVQPVPPNAGNDVTVRTRVRSSSGTQPIAIDYRMSNSSGSWKVYDVAVENLSLVTTYRSSFAEEIQRGGIDGLIKSLQAKNQSLASAG